MLGKGVDDDDDDDANKEMEKDGANTEIERERGRAFALIIVIIHPLSWQETSAQGGVERCGHTLNVHWCACVCACVYTIDARKVTLLEESFPVFFVCCQLCLRIVS